MLIKENIQRILLRGNIAPVMLFILFIASILAKSIYNPDGYVSADSANFLSLAKNISEGNGLYLTNFFAPQGKMFFAAWPIGYPVLIFLVSKIFFVSEFWAVKILTLLSLAAIFFFLKKIFSENTILFLLLLFFASMLEVFTYSLSETIFVPLLLWFCYEIYQLENGKKETLRYIRLTFSVCALFLTRYVGVVSIGVLMYFIIIALKKKNIREVVSLTSVILFSGIFIVLYLYNNKLQSGYFTGMPREESPQTLFVLLKEIVQAMVFQLDVIFAGAFSLTNDPKVKTLLYAGTLLLTGGIVLYFGRKILSIKSASTKVHQRENIFDMGYVSRIFLITGAIHFFSLIVLRWFYYYGILGFRYLAPGFFLLCIGMVAYVLERINDEQKSVLKKMVFTLAFVSWFITVPVKTVLINSSSEHPTYFSFLNELEKQYASLKQNTLVGCGEAHLLYSRLDCQGVLPLSGLHNAHTETLPEYIERLKKSSAEHVVIKIRHDLDGKGFDKSVLEFMERHRGETFVSVR
ncbi:MAG: hypothetical protein KGZ58_08235 [Ignavibacteriales bacterium]|nr:hypothetical protein [Ignavibacteriales bacterium]